MSYRTLVVISAFCAVSLLVGDIACSQTTQNTSTTLQRAVGGVSIDTDGVLKTAQQDDLGALSELRNEAMQKVPGDLNQAVGMRKISLRRLEAALNDCAKNNKPIPDAVRYLAGLQHIQYVFVYPEQNDIVLVGPGEGWRVDARGNVVGVTTGRPVMLLDDLLVALRTAMAARQGGITCSIDPTPDGLARMNQELPALRQTGNVSMLTAGIEKALGMQKISVEGVPATSHFARVLVAADYRMKRIAMAFDASPVRGLPNYLSMVKPGPHSVVSPRFWLEPKYEALRVDADGMAFELAGSSVQAMTEEDYVAASGTVKHSGKSSPMAQKWADLMTSHYAELAVADPIFGQLQNCMDMAVVAALIVKDRLPEKAGNALPTLMQSTGAETATYNAPTQVDSKASVLKKGRNWVISASGGVMINSWGIVEKAKPTTAIAPLRTQAAAGETSAWWWN